MAITINLNNATGTGTTAFTEQTPVLLFAQNDAIFSATQGDKDKVDTITVALNSFTSTMVLSLNATAASAATTNGVTVGYNSATGILTLSGSNENNTTWQPILKGVQYNDTSDAPSNPISVTVIATNGANTASNIQNISVTGVNDPATGSVTISGTATENQTLTASKYHCRSRWPRNHQLPMAARWRRH